MLSDTGIFLHSEVQKAARTHWVNDCSVAHTGEK